ncbi:MAG: DUF3592 domain-containing protein [Magnetococcales bacterium]|nr:DUF3592 domain-containing protein [Magnetococcales bacterium]
MLRPFYHSINTLSLIVGVALLVIGFYPFVRSVTSGDWPFVEGTIVASQVYPSADTGLGFHLAYRAHIEYVYQVDDQNYRGRRIEFGLGSQFFLAHSFALRINQRYPVNKTMRVYFNPHQPAEAVLERAPSMGASVVWVALGIVFTGIAFLLQFSDVLANSSSNREDRSVRRPFQIDDKNTGYVI